jgi:hypothetical protein
VAQAQLSGSGLGFADHLGRHVNAGHVTCGADLADGDERVEAGPAANVEDLLPGPQRAQRERVADAREGLDGAAGKRVDDGAGIAEELGYPRPVRKSKAVPGERDVAVLSAYLTAQHARINCVVAH